MKILTTVFVLFFALMFTACQEEEELNVADLQLFTITKVDNNASGGSNDIKLQATLPTVITGYARIDFYVTSAGISGSYPECGSGTRVGTIKDFTTSAVEVFHNDILTNSGDYHRYRVCVTTTDGNYDSSYTAEYHDNAVPFADMGELRLSGGESLEVASDKVFFSYDRDEFVRADELGMGEQILISLDDHDEIVEVGDEFTSFND